MSYETTRLGEFLNTFGKAAGLPALTLSDEGTLFLSLDGASLTLRYFPVTDDLVLASTAAKRPEGEVERLAFSREVGEGVLGLLPDGSLLVYSVRMKPGKLAYGEFEAALLGAADCVKKIRAAFSETDDVVAKPADLSWIQGPGVLSV